MVKKSEKTKERKRAAREPKETRARGEEGAERLVLRLPERIASENAGDWTMLRQVLSNWVEHGDYLAAEAERDPTKQVCFSIDGEVAEALREEAVRLTRETGETWTVSRVVARIWDRDHASATA